MFAIVRTGGKQYRVAAGDKIAVEKLAGEAGDVISLSDILLAGDGGESKDLAGVVVSAEIIAQAKADKVVVFKKSRRHNYRRKIGHRQQHTILRILGVGEEVKAGARRRPPPRPKHRLKSLLMHRAELLRKGSGQEGSPEEGCRQARSRFVGRQRLIARAQGVLKNGT